MNVPFGEWTPELVRASDPVRISALLNRRYEALLRIQNVCADNYNTDSKKAIVARSLSEWGLRDD